MKFCPKCGQDKDSLAFRKDKGRPDGLDGWCRLCRKVPKELQTRRNRAFYAKDPEGQRARRRAFYVANQEDELARAKRYRLRPEVKEANKVYYRGPGLLMIRAHVRKRRALRKQLKEAFTPAMERCIREAFGDKCLVTGETEEAHKARTGYSLHLDHVLPLIAGHPLTFENCCLLAQEINRSKGKKGIDFFNLKQQRRIRQLQVRARELHKISLQDCRPREITAILVG